MKKTFILSVLIFTLNQVYYSQNVYCVDDSNQSGVEDGTVLKPFTSINLAVAIANSGDTIKVAGGNYTPFSIVEKKLHLLGGFTGASQSDYAANISGNFVERNFETNISEIDGSINYACILISIEQAEINGNATISGFTIKNGFQGISIFGEYSGFVSNITIEDNVIVNNGTESTSQFGGGIGFEGINITIRRNVFQGNKAGRGAAISRTAGNPENFIIENNQIINNTGYDDHAGAVYLNGSGIFSHNLLEGNRAAAAFTYGWGGAVMVFNYDTTKLITLSNNVYFNNQAPSRGAAIFVDEAAKVLIDHELIFGNFNTTSEGGAAIYIDADYDNNPSVTRIVNCTVTNNTSGLQEGSGVYVQASIVEVENSIFWNNGGDDFHLSPDGQAAASIEVNYTLSQENFSGTGNISNEPFFVDPSNKDFHLKSNFGHFDIATQQFTAGDLDHSPAIDAGNPLSDYTLEPQANGARINLGVYGNTSEASKSITNSTFDLVENQFNVFPNPTNGIVHLQNISNEASIHLFNQLFQEVNINKHGPNSIDLTSFEKGIYYLKINNNMYQIINQ